MGWGGGRSWLFYLWGTSPNGEGGAISTGGGGGGGGRGGDLLGHHALLGLKNFSCYLGGFGVLYQLEVSSQPFLCMVCKGYRLPFVKLPCLSFLSSSEAILCNLIAGEGVANLSLKINLRPPQLSNFHCYFNPTNILVRGLCSVDRVEIARFPLCCILLSLIFLYIHVIFVVFPRWN